MVWQCLAAFMLCNLPFYMFVPSQDMEDMFSHSGSLPLNILGLGRRVDHGWPMSPRSPEVNTCPAFIFFFCKSLRFTCSSRERFLRKQWMLGMKMENLGITLPKWSKWGEQCSFLRILRVNIPCSADFQKKTCCFMLFHMFSQMKLNITCVLQVSMIEQKGCRGPAPWSSAEPPDRQPDRVGRVCAFLFLNRNDYACTRCIPQTSNVNIINDHQWYLDDIYNHLQNPWNLMESPSRGVPPCESVPPPRWADRWSQAYASLSWPVWGPERHSVTAFFAQNLVVWIIPRSSGRSSWKYLKMCYHVLSHIPPELRDTKKYIATSMAKSTKCSVTVTSSIRGNSLYFRTHSAVEACWSLQTLTEVPTEISSRQPLKSFGWHWQIAAEVVAKTSKTRTVDPAEYREPAWRGTSSRGLNVQTSVLLPRMYLGHNKHWPKWGCKNMQNWTIT